MTRPKVPPPDDPVLAALYEARRLIRKGPRQRFTRRDDIRFILDALIALFEDAQAMHTIAHWAAHAWNNADRAAKERREAEARGREARGLPPTPQPPPAPETPAEASALIRQLWGKPECSVILTLEKKSS
jgi:hypothetical protein